jgi:hydrogenase maturation protease
VLEVEPDTVEPDEGAPGAPGAAAAPGAPVMDAHGLAPDDIFAMLATMGGRPGRSLLVACEPADVNAGMGLSEPVRAALPHAVRAVEEILGQIGQKEGVRDAAQADHAGVDSDAGHLGGSRTAGP